MQRIGAPINTAPAGFPELNMLRGLAISMVFARHALGYAGLFALSWNGYFRSFELPLSHIWLLPINFGSAGVSIFFAVSGFCIHYFCRDYDRLGVFYIRRALRIIPPYWFLLAVISLSPFIIKEFFDTPLGVNFFSHLLLIHNFSPQTIYGIVPAWWTIAVEMQLYFMYPLLLYLTRLLGWTRTLTLIAFLELSLRLYGAVAVEIEYDGQLPVWVTGSPVFFWFSWSMGAWAAEQRARKVVFTSVIRYHACFSLAFLACVWFRPLSNLTFTVVAVWTAIYLVAPLVSPLPRWSTCVQKVGVVSYSLYLISDTVLLNIEANFAPIFEGQMSKFFLLLSSFIPAYIIATFSYRLLEKPSQELGRTIHRGVLFRVGPAPVTKAG